MRMMRRLGILCAIVAAIPAVAAAQGQTQTQTETETPALPQVIVPTPQPGPAQPAQPAPAPAARAAASFRCECYLRTPTLPRTMVTPLAGAHTLGESCQCPFGPPPPDELPSAPALGHVIQ